ncbi:serine-rich and transmembrane domain-containing protein 1 isoform X1 [Phoca vitulina]|uniref:serine-rich and transmembrane domain-containing protein 1 isoform X1 n=1 Tax=Phoca vitulina TaxID=9720 RepID=UPI0013962A8C|nr:serine-rich and transmembrane domain-containing protein 1 isoform X1 [Phoca vitulina]
MGLPVRTPLRPPDFPTLAQAPPSPERGCCPRAKHQPEQRLGGGGEWARLFAIGCADQRGGGKTTIPLIPRPGAHTPAAPAARQCAPAPRRTLSPTFPRTASRARIAETGAPTRSSARPKPHPGCRSAAGEVRASGPAECSEELDTSSWFSLKKLHVSANGHLIPCCL